MDEIKYNVNTFINKDIDDNDSIEKIFNQKLLKIILLLENSNVCQV